jgi:hypothetical protein
MGMEKVTQQNAASSQESAAASQELRSQSEQMKDIVTGLVGLVGGKNGSGNGGSKQRYLEEGLAPKALFQAQQDQKLTKTMTSDSLVSPASSPKSPQQVIPLEEDTFKDF